MALPNELTEALNNLLGKDVSFKEIDANAKAISKKYRANNNDGNRLVTSNSEAISYALSRMPATYEAVHDCMKNIFENNSFDIESILDVGAGTGAVTWALYDFLGSKSYNCFEREQEMSNIGTELMKSTELEQSVKWQRFDAIKDEVNSKYDLIVVSYMINELPKNQIVNVVEKLWNATKKLLLIIEPGTPNGFINIKNIRAILGQQGANIVAPCPHSQACPLAENDWCNFTTRVQRSRAHKLLKDGESPFEDEKYSYIAVSKQTCNTASSRILRHPNINKGFIEHKICSNEGIIKCIKLSKKDGAIYKEAKKKSAGDSLNI